MNSLLIVAHGSRREPSNNEIRELTTKVAERAKGQFDLIDCAFLELATPSIPDGIQSLIDKGAKKVLVVPYFLARGTHVVTDIPSEVAKAQSHNPTVSIAISRYLGSSDAIPELLMQLAQSADTPTEQRKPGNL